MLLLLLLRLLQGAEWVGRPGVQAGTGWSQRSQALDDEFKLQVQRLVTVHEGLCVFVSCNFSYPRSGWQDTDPAYGYWYHKQQNKATHHQQDVLVATNDPARKVHGATEGRFQLLGDPGAKTCSLGITDARKEDGGKYFFRLERGKTLQYSYKLRLTVNVAAVRLVPISITGSLDSGHRSNVTCSVPSACDRGTPLAFSWAGPALRSQEPHPGTSNLSVVTLTPSPQDHGTNLTCRVTFPRLGVTAERTITLNVSYAPQNLTIGLLRGECTWKYLDYLGSSRSLGVLEGDSVRLVCVADSSPPATEAWGEGCVQVGGCGVISRRTPGGKPECAGFVQAATLGAGLATAIFLCACLIFLVVKRYRKKTTKMAGPEVPSAMGTVAQGGPRKAPPRGPAPATPILGEAQVAGQEGTRSPAVPEMEDPEAQDSQLLYSSFPAMESPEVQGSQLQCPRITETQDPELHYTALVFPRQRPRAPPEQEATSCTEYAEITIRK
ncbi:LOW QUALITY PROTEIN: sialic acid-binding Ig-like lectin 13 [Echinops telfairi]|uniref:LOW QUALITY PROTEIN: sialic acid-binding Ig-like lectin 13 n=1 Tax=Echinops telfairi TaxID=9371 RepID=A0ABM1VKM1_ECHTE|nr:LOW QUALITY PROTEIN: sialic acid-binding Ig-like lectin 13 [Echinops telfairi]